eukprot:441422-Amphidinium_carterae.1
MHGFWIIKLDVQTSETDTKGGTLGSTKVEALEEDGEAASLFTDCLQEDLSSSDDDDFSWASLEQLGGPYGSKVRGFDSEAEEWNIYLDTAKHMEELEQDVARHAASCPTWHSKARLCGRKMKTGRRRARCVGSGGTRSSLPSVAEEEACDAFFERTEVDEPDEFEGSGRTIFARSLRSVSDQLSARVVVLLSSYFWLRWQGAPCLVSLVML